MPTKLSFRKAHSMKPPKDCPYQPMSFDALATLSTESIGEIFGHWAERNEIDRGTSPEFELDEDLTSHCLRWVLRGRTIDEAVQIVRSKLCCKYYLQDGYRSLTDVAAAINRCRIADRELPVAKVKEKPKQPKRKKSSQFPK
jgi:hypothetical protein